MSADNGVYILKTSEGEHRVLHTQAIENIYKGTITNFDFLNIYKYFHKCKSTKNRTTAFNIASTIYENLPICEYGIVPISIDKSWDDIVLEADIAISQKINDLKSRNFHNRLYSYDQKNLIYDLKELYYLKSSINGDISKIADYKIILDLWRHAANLNDNDLLYVRYERDRSGMVIYSTNIDAIRGDFCELLNKYTDALKHYCKLDWVILKEHGAE